MTKRSLSTLQTNINNDINTNGANGITGAELNAVLVDTTDSFVHQDFSTLTAPTLASGDLLAVNDIDDAGNIKKTTVGDIIGLVPAPTTPGTVQQGTFGTIIANDQGSPTGNARGAYSIDLQTKRLAVDQVASGSYSSLLGGRTNMIIGDYSVICGGNRNENYGGTCFLGGGKDNFIGKNTATYWATICGGSENEADGNYSTICGGYKNRITILTGSGGKYNTICGGGNNSILNNGFNPGRCAILGGYKNRIWGTTTWTYASSILGGSFSDITDADDAIIGSGYDNRITGSDNSFIGSGQINYVNGGGYGFIGNGGTNVMTSSWNSSILNGDSNTLTSCVYSFIGGGKSNSINEGNYSSISNGIGNKINHSTITATNISFSTSPNRISQSIGDFTNSFGVGEQIVVSGSASNNGTFTITAISTLYLEVAETLVIEGVGASVTITTQRSLTSTTISFSSPQTIELGSGSWLDAGIRVGNLILVSGSASNNKVFYVRQVSASNLIVRLVSGATGVVTAGAGPSITVKTISQSNSIDNGIYNIIHGSIGFIGGGRQNIINGGTDSILGGYKNYILGSSFGNVSGGRSNKIYSTDYSVVGGGHYNSIGSELPAVSNWCTIGGGHFNEADGYHTTVSGGKSNFAHSDQSVIGGGYFNKIYSGNNASTIAGGYRNTIRGTGRVNTIAGGYKGKIGTTAVFSSYNFIGSSYYNDIGTAGFQARSCAIVTGQRNEIGSVGVTNYSFIGNGNTNEITQGKYNSITNGKTNKIGEGAFVGNYCSIGGGKNNTIANLQSSSYSTIAGGLTNTISRGGSGFIGGGSQNSIGTVSSAHFGVIVGGLLNKIYVGSRNFIGTGFDNKISSGSYNFIGSGLLNNVAGSYNAILTGNTNRIYTSSWYSLITSGQDNKLTGSWSCIVGGDTNTVNGSRSCIVGGDSNSLNGNYSSIINGKTNTNNGGYSSITNGKLNKIKHISYTGTNISFTATSTITRTTGSFRDDGFRPGMIIRVFGSTSNNAVYTIATVAALTLTVTQTSIVNELAGASVTITTERSITATNISFNAGVTLYTITGASGSWNAAGFKAGDSVIISGGLNNGRKYFVKKAGNGTTLTVYPATMTTESAGTSITVSSLPSNNNLDNGVNNFISSGTGLIGNGYNNILNSGFSSILHGYQNEINNGEFNTVIGGMKNYIRNGSYNISAGLLNYIGTATVLTNNSSILGGGFNRIGTTNNTKMSVVCGGWGNSVNNDYGFVGGGYNNDIVAGTYSFMGGGKDNKIGTNLLDCYYGVICGGNNNKIGDTFSAKISTIVGGTNNSINGRYGFIGGGYNNDIIRGDSNTIVAGSDNKIGHASASSPYSSIVGGLANNIGSSIGNSKYSFIGGGSNNLIGSVAISQYSFIGSGQGNKTDAFHGFIGAGRGNNVNTTYGAILSGTRGVTRRFAEIVQSAGRFGSDGDAQTGHVVGRILTTTNSATELFLNGSSERLILTDDSTLAVKGIILGRRVDGGGEASAHYEFWALIDRDTGVATTNLIASNITVNHEDNINWAVALSADTTNGSLKIDVTGDTGETVQWVAYVYYAETIE